MEYFSRCLASQKRDILVCYGCFVSSLDVFIMYIITIVDVRAEISTPGGHSSVPPRESLDASHLKLVTAS